MGQQPTRAVRDRIPPQRQIVEKCHILQRCTYLLFILLCLQFTVNEAEYITLQ